MSELKSQNKPGKGCLKAVFIFVCVFALLGIIATIIIYLNWDSISQLPIFDPLNEMSVRFSTEQPYLESLSEKLRDEYPSQSVFINIRSSSTSEQEENSLGLSVEFLNPGFIKSSNQTDGLELAKKIAIVVVENYPTILDYDLVTIKFTNEKGFGFTITKSQEYHFQISELLDFVN